MIITFGWTTPALLAGAKTVTRRAWSQGHARRFTAGQLVEAWDRSPRFGGRAVATLRLLRAPYREHSFDIPRADFSAEGFAWLCRHGDARSRERGDAIWREWREAGHVLWVVRFELVSLVADCPELDTSSVIPNS